MERNITVIPAKKRSHSVKAATTKDKLRVAAYCRVSTDREEQLNSFENQVEYYTQYITSKPEYELAGIYSDEGITATNTKKREGFNRMIADCDAGKIDMVITKSISRFARNTQDCLQYSRHLKELGIGVIFEKENINTMDASGELLFTILSSLAQEESRNISENCKWAIRHNFANGKPSLNDTLFMGYDKDEDGKLVINPEQAKVVRRIFRLFEEGLPICRIGQELKSEGVKGMKTGSWAYMVIKGMLQNEKYCGDILMQKTYTKDFLTKKKVVNHGEVDQYFMENCHEAIIPKDEWQAVQLEFKRQEAVKAEFGCRNFGRSTTAFSMKLVCNTCGKLYGRMGPNRYGNHFWMCSTKRDGNSHQCHSDNVKEEIIERAFVIAWNSVVSAKREHEDRWNDMIKNGNPLERLRARQMMMLVKEGPVKTIVNEHVFMVLERMIIFDKSHFEVRFLDGTIKNVVVN